jgi:hypothetical protein
MTVYFHCDYCGRPIEQEPSVKLEYRGYRPCAERFRTREPVNEYFGHFHTGHGTADDGGSCFDRITAAVDLAMSWGPTLESIDTLTGQAVAARRRKHTRPDEEA